MSITMGPSNGHAHREGVVNSVPPEAIKSLNKLGNEGQAAKAFLRWLFAQCELLPTTVDVFKTRFSTYVAATGVSATGPSGGAVYSTIQKAKVLRTSAEKTTIWLHRPCATSQSQQHDNATTSVPSMNTVTFMSSDTRSLGSEARLVQQFADNEDTGDSTHNDSGHGTILDGPVLGRDAMKYFEPLAPLGRDGNRIATMYVGRGCAEDCERVGIELGLLGHTYLDSDDSMLVPQPHPVYLNVSHPFCLVTVGVQGSGKSHTLNCVLECCLLQCKPVSHVRQPMAALVCHYDRSNVNCCEATGLGRPNNTFASMLRNMEQPKMSAPFVAKENMLVLCSPSYYKQRSRYYEGVCQVKPLLFSWSSLSAQQIKMLMKLDESSPQLYVSMMLDKLRGYQRDEKTPTFESFFKEVRETCMGTQAGPLEQRLQLLSTFMLESDVNRDLVAAVYGAVDVAMEIAAGRLVMCDLTDPMMSPADANCIFQVVLDTFRRKDTGCGKMVAFDEAHRYMGMNGTSDALAADITDCARLMRHEGLRVVISTQSPKAMPEELLELTSVLVAHRFQSVDWHHHLAKKVPFPAEIFASIRALGAGDAWVYSAQPAFGRSANMDAQEVSSEADVLHIHTRKRLTMDLGASRKNTAAIGAR